MKKIFFLFVDGSLVRSLNEMLIIVKVFMAYFGLHSEDRNEFQNTIKIPIDKSKTNKFQQFH